MGIDLYAELRSVTSTLDGQEALIQSKLNSFCQALGRRPEG